MRDYLSAASERGGSKCREIRLRDCFANEEAEHHGVTAAPIPPPSKTSPSPNRKPAKTWVRPMRPRREQFARDDIHEVWSLRALERIRLPPEDLHVSQLSGERIWGR